MDRETFDRQVVEAERQVQLAADYQRTFSGDYGERVLLDLLEYCGMLRSSYQGKETPMEMAFREGERAVALRILEFMKTDVAKFRQLVKERIAHESEVI